MAEFLRSLMWFFYRLLRRLWFTVTNRNPLVRGEVAPSLISEWRSVRGLARGLQTRPERIRTDALGRTLWRTSIGEFWVPAGADDHFVQQLSNEMLALVYDLTDLRNSGGLSQTLVMDCGSNVGCFARWALLQGVKQVVCVEPSPRNIACLRLNLEAEIAQKKVLIVEKGVWDSVGTLSFAASNQKNPGSHHVSAEGQGTTTISVTTIDDLVGELGLDRLDYIKMDIEGSELRAIQGARRTIQRMRPQLCAVTEHTDDLYSNAVAVIDLMRQLVPGIRYRATEAHPFESPSLGLLLAPYSLLFHY